MNYSFWADESYISGIAAQWVLGKISFLQAINAPGITYQRLHMMIVSLFFKVFGVSEFVARIPSILGYLLGIAAIYLLAKRLSNKWGGVLSAFLYAFSHLNLAYATQAKPYITIEALLLVLLYILTDKKRVQHVMAIILCVIATLLHSIGVFLWVVYFVSILVEFSNSKVKKLNQKYIWIIVLIVATASVFILPMILSNVASGLPFKYNNIYQITKLFVYKYSLITVCGLLGFIWFIKKKKEVSIGLIAYVFILFVFVSFTIYIFNIRYVLTLFGILFLYFGIFWAKVGEKYAKRFSVNTFKRLHVPTKAIVPLAVIILLYTTGYKIVRWPQAYYNPNIDKYGDVQIANYKDFYSKLKQRFPNYKNMYVVNDTFDAEYWYFGRYSNAYFMKGTTQPVQHSVVKNAIIFGSLDNFKTVMQNHPQGLLIMEDWQSFLPDDIKMYAKKNLKLEFRVESLKEASNDPWPLALYSWGYDVKNVTTSTR